MYASTLHRRLSDVLVEPINAFLAYTDSQAAGQITALSIPTDCKQIAEGFNLLRLKASVQSIICPPPRLTEQAPSHRNQCNTNSREIPRSPGTTFLPIPIPALAEAPRKTDGKGFLAQSN